MINVDEAVSAVAAGTTVFAVVGVDVVVVEGADAASYLQGQLSQNTETLTVGHSTWSFLLQPQGKVDAWFRLTRRSDEVFIIDVRQGFGEAVVERLNRFKLRVEAELGLVETCRVVVRGSEPSVDAPRLADAIGGLAVPADWSGQGDPGRPYDVLGISSANQAVTAEAMIDAANTALPGALQAEGAYVEWDRIERAIPAMGLELDESTIPAAVGVVDVSADFTKGCYVGQELVARVDSRGSNTPTKLVQVTAVTDLGVNPGSALSVEGVDAGTLTSAEVGGGRLIGLAYVKRSAIDQVTAWPTPAVVAAENGEAIAAEMALVSHSAGS